MQVDQLALEDFRNYERAEIAFAPGLNLILGPNAQGKTNLLEAVHCLGGMGSPRGADSTLVREGTERAVLHAAITRRERSVRVDLEIKPGRGMRALLNKTPVSGMKTLRELVVTVFFGPDELSLVKGSPEGRRSFLDELVVKLRPAQDLLRRDFERVLKQRNALLKSAPRRSTSPSLPTLEVWDDAFARAGAELAAARLGALAKLLPHAQGRYEDVAGGGRLELAYSSSWVPDEVAGAAMTDGAQPDVETLREALAASIAAVRVREIERGLSLSGPQRDDILVQLRGGDSLSESLLDARTYASQGDQRTSALALKLGEHDLLAAALDDQPILLLDDVFSELDPSRRSWLAKTVLDLGQTIVSATDLGDTKLAGTERVFEVHRGAVSQA